MLDKDVPVEEAVAAFLAQFDLKPGEEREWRDPAGGIITISQRLFERRDENLRTTGMKVDRGRLPFLRFLALACLMTFPALLRRRATAAASNPAVSGGGRIGTGLVMRNNAHGPF